MKKIVLSSRLQCVASAALGGGKIIDVGTDHGYVPVWLAQSDALAAITAADINEAPLQSARSSAIEYGVASRIRFVLADGVDFPGAEGADTVIIAGMGGETIAGILAGRPWTRGARLILQPQSKQDELCLWLRGNGYGIAGAALCRDAGRLYMILSVTGGESPWLYGEEALLALNDPLLPDWLSARVSRTRAALGGMARSERDGPEMFQARRLLKRLEAIEKELT